MLRRRPGATGEARDQRLSRSRMPDAALVPAERLRLAHRMAVPALGGESSRRNERLRGTAEGTGSYGRDEGGSVIRAHDVCRERVSLQREAQQPTVRCPGFWALDSCPSLLSCLSEYAGQDNLP